MPDGIQVVIGRVSKVDSRLLLVCATALPLRADRACQFNPHETFADWLISTAPLFKHRPPIAEERPLCAAI